MTRELSLALDMSDRTVALHLGLAPLPRGIRLQYVPQAKQHRHERMLESLEWDICEFSLATYLAARANGAPLVAIPIFPRRIFAAALFFVRADSGIAHPHDLIDHRVGIRSFHTTLCVWGLGDLSTVYDVPLADIVWVTERDDPFPRLHADTWPVERVEAGESLETALERGALDAILVPRVPRSVWNRAAVPLFEDPVAAIRDYVAKTGVYPIMHTLVTTPEVLDDRPELPTELMAAFEESKRVGYLFYDDPNWCLLADATHALRAQRELLGEDPYPYGLDANVKAVTRLVDYEHRLGLIPDTPAPSLLFSTV